MKKKLYKLVCFLKFNKKIEKEILHLLGNHSMLMDTLIDHKDMFKKEKSTSN